MAEYKFGFIGVGNMGSALVRAAVKNLNPSSIVISNRSHEKADKLAAEIKEKAVSFRVLGTYTSVIG